ncbi:MAG: 16S rRNA (cytidine(1402)-2'-O)-methyltransferase [Candidatus Pacebacteria bacterium]|nr:16S rRNA (cytidine(1402)-2'-O)-methyltransferase [Candidatus Paceibacterota bacterium]
MSTHGKLSIVSTPIGNLGDITMRALEILRAADVILCEDTRHSGKLLSHFEIKKPLRSFHAHSTDNETAKILELIEEGKHLALVTDAGTPGISDPGTILISKVLEVYGSEAVEIIPGPSALTAAIARSGIPTHQFRFLGFAPAKKGRQTFFADIAANPDATVFYESSHKIEKTMAELAKVLDGGRIIALCRELTKMHEETIRGTAEQVKEVLASDANKLRGEHVIIVAPKDFYIH